ncbi:MAG: four helix bundle protein [Bacteroidota bacterium]
MKPYNYEDRLVAYAGECIFFIKSLPLDRVGQYYADQILRSAGSAALHYGEAQGTNTKKDFIHKVINVIKELKENRTAYKIMVYVNYGDHEKRRALIQEVQILIKIGNTMVLNAKKT